MLGLAVPIMLSNLSVPLVGLVDTAVMGRLPGPTYLGAVALGTTVFTFLFWGFGFLRMGTTGLVAQALGRRDAQALRGLALTLGLGAAVIGLGLLLLQGPIGRVAVALLPADPPVETALLDYYHVRIWSAPAVLGNYVLMGLLIGLQRTGLALLAQLTLNLGNAGLSLWFVLGMDGGIAGVALASVLAEYAALGAGLLALRWALAPHPGAWPWSDLRDPARFAMLVRINGDLFVRTICLICAFAWFNAQGAALGASFLAVNAVLMQFLHVLSYGLDGFAHAAETLVGQARGARRQADHRAAVRIATRWAVGVAVGYVVLYWLAGDQLVAALTVDDGLRALAAQFLPWVWLAPLVAVWSYLLDGVFVGTLRTRDMRNAMIASLAVFLFASMVGLGLAGNHGLWAALMVFFAMRAATLAALDRFRPLAWPERPGSGADAVAAPSFIDDRETR